MADKFYIKHIDTPKQSNYKILFITQTGYKYNIINIVTVKPNYSNVDPKFGVEYSDQFKQLGIGRYAEVCEKTFLSCLDNIDNIKDLYKNVYFPEDKHLKRHTTTLKGVLKSQERYQISSCI